MEIETKTERMIVMATLHVFMGLTGSNRKEEAKAFADKQQLALITSDDVREELRRNHPDVTNAFVFEEIYRRLKKILNDGENAVFDATNLHGKQRLHLTQMLKGHELRGYMCVQTLETCVSQDANSPKPLGKEVIQRQVMTAEIPFQNEGSMSTLTYLVEHLPVEETMPLVIQKDESDHEDEVTAWANVLLESGKELFDSLPEGKHKKIGYNNISAYIAFQTLYSLNYDIDVIEQVVKVILYKKRFMNTTESGKEKLIGQIGEELYRKVEALK